MLKTENIESIQCLRTLNHMFSLILTKCSRIQNNDKKKSYRVRQLFVTSCFCSIQNQLVVNAFCELYVH